MPRPAFSFGCSFPISKVRARSEASAWALLIPGFSRPTTKLLSLLRLSSQLLPGSMTGPIIIGVQNSDAKATSVPTKPLRATPMTVNGTLLKITVRPTMPGSEANRFCQHP
jgi:hypothetical protein